MTISVSIVNVNIISNGTGRHGWICIDSWVCCPHGSDGVCRNCVKRRIDYKPYVDAMHHRVLEDDRVRFTAEYVTWWLKNFDRIVERVKGTPICQLLKK